MSEYRRLKINDTHVLIAYHESKTIPGAQGRPSGNSTHEVAFKVTPVDGGVSVPCSPEAAGILIAMLARGDG